MKKLLFGIIVLTSACSSHFGRIQTSRLSHDQPPNIIIIMADDLGYGDISPYGGWIETPNLDRMAIEGMLFTNFYASGPVCSPTRAGLLTGRYQQRAGIPGVVYAAPDRNRHHGLQTHESTFAEILKDAGYATGIFGKWHLGYERKYNPIQHGFDEFRGYVSGNIDYFSHVDQAGFYDWWSQDELVNEPGYVTHLITRYAVSFIERNRDRPFALYLPHEAPHAPFQGPADEPFRIVNKQVPEMRDSSRVKIAYRQMVQELDASIGEVMRTLERLGLENDTLVLFFSDNGAMPFGSNGNLKGYKGSLWEGGIRVPAIARWKGKIAAGTFSDQQAITLDVFSTILALAGENASGLQLDGIDLSTILLEQAAPKPRALFWEYGKQTAFREDYWKILQGVDESNTVRLFNLEKDPGETTDVAKSFPGRVAEMSKTLKAWKQEVMEGATLQPEKRD